MLYDLLFMVLCIERVRVQQMNKSLTSTAFDRHRQARAYQQVKRNDVTRSNIACTAYRRSICQAGRVYQTAGPNHHGRWRLRPGPTRAFRKGATV
jgi:hypothetical protein